MVFKVVTGTLVSTNIQEFWTSDIGLNLQDVKPLNVGSLVKISYESRYVKRWTRIKPKEVDKHAPFELLAIILSSYSNKKLVSSKTISYL